MNTNKPFKPLALAAVCSLLFAGCATMGTNETLEAARTEVNAASANPDVISKAPLELKTAKEALDRADRAQRDHEDLVEVNHHAYLAQARARTAQDFATARRATDDMMQAQGDVDRMRLAMRTREADSARAAVSVVFLTLGALVAATLTVFWAMFSRLRPATDAGKFQMVLTFRNVHNWRAQGQAEGMFKGFFEVLKPGGVLLAGRAIFASRGYCTRPGAASRDGGKRRARRCGGSQPRRGLCGAAGRSGATDGRQRAREGHAGKAGRDERGRARARPAVEDY